MEIKSWRPQSDRAATTRHLEGPPHGMSENKSNYASNGFLYRATPASALPSCPALGGLFINPPAKVTVTSITASVNLVKAVRAVAAYQSAHYAAMEPCHRTSTNGMCRQSACMCDTHYVSEQPCGKTALRSVMNLDSRHCLHATVTTQLSLCGSSFFSWESEMERNPAESS